MLISTPGHESIIAAQNMDTLIVLPNRRGVEMRISCAMWSQLFTRRTFMWSRANWPGGSSFQKLRVHAFRKSSWKSRWW